MIFSFHLTEGNNIISQSRLIGKKQVFICIVIHQKSSLAAAFLQIMRLII